MEIDVSIWTLAKLGIATLGTYFLLPLVLVIRDRALWWSIDKFILTEELYRRVQQYTSDAERWNREFAVKTKFGWSQSDGYNCSINGRSVDRAEYIEFQKQQEDLGNKIDAHRWEIQKKKNLIDRLLKHYTQDDENPIQMWVNREARKATQEYEERMAKGESP